MLTLPSVLSVAASRPWVELWEGSLRWTEKLLRDSPKVPQWEKVVALSRQALFSPPARGGHGSVLFPIASPEELSQAPVTDEA